MNQKIRELDIEKALFWDLECIRAQEELIPDTEEYYLFETKNRNRDTDEVLPEAELLELYRRKGGLNLTLNKIVCISMGVVSGGKIFLKSIVGEQKDIIEEFSKVLHKGYTPVGWNIIGFDFPVLRQKAFQEGVVNYAPDNLNDSGKKSWEMEEIKYKTNIIDLMTSYKGSYFYNQSLAEACYSAGISSPKNGGIEGSQVSEVYYAEGVERIAEYCERDVLACIHLFQKMRGEELIQNIEIRNEVKLEEPNLLEMFYNDDCISLHLEEELKKVVEENPPTKKEWENIQRILEGIYERNDFINMNQDNKAQKEAKEIEIENLIQRLKNGK